MLGEEWSTTKLWPSVLAQEEAPCGLAAVCTRRRWN
jgi:hypothetical protein